MTQQTDAVAVATETAGQLSLWQFSNQEMSVNLQRFTSMTYKKSDNGNERIKIAASKRKEIAELSGLKGKANAQALQRKILEIKDDLKERLAKEMVGIVQDEAYTGGSMVVTKSAKTGLRKVVFSFEELPEGSRGASDEEIAKALGWTIDQVRAARKRQQAALDKAEVDTDATVTTETKE